MDSELSSAGYERVTLWLLLLTAIILFAALLHLKDLRLYRYVFMSSEPCAGCKEKQKEHKHDGE